MPYKDSWGEKAKERSKNRTAYFIEYRKKEPEKKNARAAVQVLVKKGIIFPLPCRDFSTKCHGRIEAHHPDYNKPLEVIWFCSYHHRQEHIRIKPEYSGWKFSCEECGVQIFPPKVRYCSNRCNLRAWRKAKSL